LPIDQSLMLGLKKHGFEILGVRGIASCSTCHVYLEPADYDASLLPSLSSSCSRRGTINRSGSSAVMQLRVADAWRRRHRSAED